MNEKAYPLLLTGTIDSSVYNNTGNLIRDIETRKQQYENAIERYIKETPFTPVVFIENSGFDFNAEYFKAMAAQEGKQFEFISGKVCVEEIVRYGKSYGDAYLIWEGLQKSELLKEYDFFYKITGRIFLKNAKKICKTRDKYRNEFVVYSGMGWCFTNIFKANKADYLRVLGEVFLDCDEGMVRDIEICFYRRLAASDLQLGSFETYPYFDGVMGATGRNYSGKLPERIIRNIMARMHAFAYNSAASKMIVAVMRLLGKKGYAE